MSVNLSEQLIISNSSLQVFIDFKAQNSFLCKFFGQVEDISIFINKILTTLSHK